MHNYLQENEEVISRRSGCSRKTKLPGSKSISKSKCRSSGKSIKEQDINEKMKLAKLEALASFRQQQKTHNIAGEEVKLEEILAKGKARVKVFEG